MTTCGRRPKHSLNPVAATCALIDACVLAVSFSSPICAGVFVALLLVLHWVRGFPQRAARRRLVRLLVFACMLSAVQVLLVRDKPVTLRLANGALMSFRFLSIVLASNLFVTSVEAEDLAYALMQMGMAYRYGYALIAALRFVPYFQEQVSTVTDAQLARGLGVGKPTLKGVYLRARYTFVPVAVTALNRVDSLALSMEGRCFGLYRGRTFRRKITLTPWDVAVIVLSLALLVAAVIRRWVG